MKKINYMLFTILVLMVGSLNVEALDTNKECLITFFGNSTMGHYIDDCDKVNQIADIVEEAVDNSTQIEDDPSWGYTTGRFTMEIWQDGEYMATINFEDDNVVMVNGDNYKVNTEENVYDAIVAIVTEHGIDTPNLSYLVYGGINIVAEATTGNAGSSLKLKVKDITLPSGAEYYVQFVNSGDPIPNGPFNRSQINTDHTTITGWKNIIATTGEVFINDDWYLLNDYDQYRILACSEIGCEIGDEPYNIERPALPSLGQRYKIYAFSNNLNEISVFPYFPFTGENGSHTINVKIGIINDKNIIDAVMKNEENGLADLMDYAKTAEGVTYTEKDDKFYEISLNNFKVQNGAYYFLYTTYENEDGLYRDLSDISMVLGQNNMLVNPLDSDSTEPNANTGDMNIIALAGVLLLCAGGAYVAYRKSRLN